MSSLAVLGAVGAAGMCGSLGASPDEGVVIYGDAYPIAGRVTRSCRFASASVAGCV